MVVQLFQPNFAKRPIFQLFLLFQLFQPEWTPCQYHSSPLSPPQSVGLSAFHHLSSPNSGKLFSFCPMTVKCPQRPHTFCLGMLAEKTVVVCETHRLPSSYYKVSPLSYHTFHFTYGFFTPHNTCFSDFSI